VPGPNVTFLPLDCPAARLVTLVLIPQLEAGGQCSGCPIQGFAAFYIQGCRDEDGKFNSRCVVRNCGNDCPPNVPGEQVLKNTGQLYLEGMFINYVEVAARGGPLNKFGIMGLFLVE
jgi:hypothetical protein